MSKFAQDLTKYATATFVNFHLPADLSVVDAPADLPAIPVPAELPVVDAPAALSGMVLTVLCFANFKFLTSNTTVLHNMGSPQLHGSKSSFRQN